MPIKVFIIDSSDIVRTGLAKVLNSDESIEVVGDSVDFPTAQPAITSTQPDVVIVDLGLRQPSCLEHLLALRQELPALELLIFTSKDCAISVQQFLAVGVKGYIVKEASRCEIIAAVQAVAAGRQIVSISEISRLGSPVSLRSEQGHPSIAGHHRGHELSAREREVLVRIARGLTNQGIANELFLSIKTIETYRSRLTKKIGARNRADLYEYACQNGMLTQVPVSA